MIILTKPQRTELYRIWLQTQEPHVPRSQRPSYRYFRKLVRLEICGNGTIMIPFAGMWLGIEPNGHSHS